VANSCQKRKPGRLLARKVVNRRFCTACDIPVEERKKMGVLNTYENPDTQVSNQNTKQYRKPISNETLTAITGEHHGVKKSS